MNRRSLVAAAAILAAAWLSAAPVVAQGSRPTSSYDRGSDGLWAYGKWLSEIGYRTNRIDRYTSASLFEIPFGTQVLLLLSPSYRIPQGDAEKIRSFVRAGGLLIYVARDEARALDDGFGLNPGESAGAGWPQRVAADSLGVARGISINCVASGVLGEVYAGYVTGQQALLTADDAPTTISFQYGLGKVVATTAPCMFTNRSMADRNTSTVARAFIRLVPPGSNIAFDEFHHFSDPGAFILDLDDFTPSGRRVSRGPSNFELSFGSLPLASSAWGTALLIALLTCFVWLLANGRRLGKTIPLPTDIRPRTSADFAVAMANLHERSGDTRGMRAHLRRKLKRAIGKPIGIDQETPDEDFAAQVARARPDIDPRAIVQTLATLAIERTGQAELVTLSSDVKKLMERYR
ncbi:MAG: DUF4350 domain-containing protein [Thermoflexales bacterium]